MKELNNIREILVPKYDMLRRLGFKATYVEITIHDANTFKVTLTTVIDKDIDETSCCDGE